jgi:hypothetical protein
LTKTSSRSRLRCASKVIPKSRFRRR